MAAKGKQSGMRGEAPPVLIIIAVVLLVIGLGTGAYYAYNGGWKTTAQKQDEYQHIYGPILAAKHGDMGPLEAENRLRKEHGQPPLEVPKDHEQTAADSRQKLAELQKILAEKQGQHGGQ